MWRLVKRWWNYLVMRGHLHHEQTADPTVQLEQSMQEARERDRQLRESAAIVLANQKQAQKRLDVAVLAYEKAQASAGQALLLAEQESRRGRPDKAAGLTAAAEGFAERMLSLQSQVDESERALLAATSAAEKAKSNVQQNAEQLERRMRDKERLLDELDRAKMQESVNQASEQLSKTFGSDVPTFDEVSKKIAKRLSVAESQAELLALVESSPLDAQMLEIEKIQRSAAAQVALDGLRAQLGLPAPSSYQPVLRRVELAAADETETRDIS
jgi:phage shock protein A